ncbi:MAG TPA: hypothetical protein VD994_08225 [Prosthecobacter sp.]|nr:hypothetical protein [Prosthecobacter sp.]
MLEASLVTAAVNLATFITTQLEKHAPKFVQRLNDKLPMEKAIHTYMARYQDAYGTVKPIGMPRPIRLEDIYTEVQFTTENLRQYFSDKGLEQSALRSLRQSLDKSKITTLHGITAANQFQRLLVVGHPGSGKSTYLRRVGWECLRTHKITTQKHSGEARYEHTLLPVLLELKRCRGGKTAALIDGLAKEFATAAFRKAPSWSKAC